MSVHVPIALIILVSYLEYEEVFASAQRKEENHGNWDIPSKSWALGIVGCAKMRILNVQNGSKWVVHHMYIYMISYVRVSKHAFKKEKK